MSSIQIIILHHGLGDTESQGLDSKMKGTRVVTILTSKGCLDSMLNSRGINCIFVVIKEVKVLHSQDCFRGYSHSFSDIANLCVAERVYFDYYEQNFM